MNKLQVSLNDVRRSIVGCKVEDILDESSIPSSINRLVIETIGVERWKALKVRDAPDLPLTHPLGNLMTAGSSGGSNSSSNSRNSCYTLATRQTRAGASGSLHPPLKFPSEAFVWWAAYRLWN